MILDSHRYEAARQARDARFDGRFFVGVLTTGIYCRPVCPVRIPRQENVRLYPSAAAAAEAGFRPCLRCRPEVSPGTPAWLGSSFTVSRALQLIEQGVMDGGSVELLASRLGIGTRQLTRLFKRNLGASPISVAQTRRLHFAKQLIDETTLPMSDICFAAGFGSIRRFNDLFKSTYGRTPRQLRLGGRKPVKNGGEIKITLAYRPPFDWRGMLQFLALRATAGVEEVSDTGYFRTISIEGVTGEFGLVFSATDPRAELTIDFPDTRQLLNIVEQVRQLFDLKADSVEIEAQLSEDPLLAILVGKYPGLRVPGCWDGFEIAVRAIVGQQVSVKAASTLVGRITARHGLTYQSGSGNNNTLIRVFPDTQILVNADLSGLGIPGRKIAAIHAVASAVVASELRFDGSQTIEEFIRRICQIKGIGEWTAQYIALRALRDPNAFPHGDLILQRSAGAPGKALTASQLLSRADSWQPWRAYSVLLLWRHYQQTH
ncbi:MAG: DNA-3-methyladenine glycosylase 2 family protein [Gammaproteobacteria bacterium]|nr:DNA-3-methyladenine glycosylase 2 family protein [Gammaproteobacteria bacterium]